MEVALYRCRFTTGKGKVVFCQAQI